MKRYSFIQNLFRDHRGVAAIEFAIVVPALLWLLMGIIEFGIIFHLQSLSTYAANEAARRGKTGYDYGYDADVVTGDAARKVAIESAVRERLKPWMGGSTLNIDSQSYGTFNDLGANGVAGQGNGGELVLYTITYNRPMFTPLFSNILGDGDGRITIQSRVLVKNEDF